MHHRRINLEHILMGVVREEDGTVGQILRSAGLNVINMREQMLLEMKPLLNKFTAPAP